MNRKMFKDFDAYEPSLVEALRFAKIFVNRLKASPWKGGYCLSFVGESGNGKTLLARTILNELRLNPWGACESVRPLATSGELRRFEARLFDMRKVSDQFKAGEYYMVEAMEQPALAVLDDVGADYDPNKIMASKLDRVLRNRAGRWTIITANMRLAEIAQHLDSRIASWLIRDENKVVEITAGDYALK